jgi:hypothetical protein
MRSSGSVIETKADPVIYRLMPSMDLRACRVQPKKPARWQPMTDQDMCGRKADKSMRQVTFPLFERFVLTPVDAVSVSPGVG